MHLSELANLLSQTHSNDEETKLRALTWAASFRNSEEAQRLAIESCLEAPFEEHLSARLYLLEALQVLLRDNQRWGALGDESRQVVRERLLRFCASSSLQAPIPLRNTVALALAQLFRIDYISAWPGFFADVASASVDMFVRVLQQIDVEFVSRDYVHIPEVAAELKDLMRDRKATDLIVSVILQRVVEADNETHDQRERRGRGSSSGSGGVRRDSMTSSWASVDDDDDPELDSAAHALSVLPAYIRWIDINLLVNESAAPLLQQLVLTGQRSPLRAAAAVDCLAALVNKGMDPAAKLAVISALQLPAVIEAGRQAGGPTRFRSRLARLLGMTGTEVLAAISAAAADASDASTSIAAAATAAENELLPPLLDLLLEFIRDPAQLVASEPLIFAQTFASKLGPSDPRALPLLRVIAGKMRLPTDYSVADKDEYENDFDEFRGDLDKLFSAVCRAQPETAANFVYESCATCFAHHSEGHLTWPHSSSSTTSPSVSSADSNAKAPDTTSDISQLTQRPNDEPLDGNSLSEVASFVESIIHIFFQLGESVPRDSYLALEAAGFWGQLATMAIRCCCASTLVGEPQSAASSSLLASQADISSRERVPVASPHVFLALIDCSCRYARQFGGDSLKEQSAGEQGAVAIILRALVSWRGLRHPLLPIVRSRAAYGLLRLVKSLRVSLAVHFDPLVAALEPLLAVPHPQPPYDQIQLYEAVGTLAVYRDDRANVLQNLLRARLNLVESACASSPELAPSLVAHALLCLGHAAKGVIQLGGASSSSSCSSSSSSSTSFSPTTSSLATRLAFGTDSVSPGNSPSSTNSSNSTSSLPLTSSSSSAGVHKDYLTIFADLLPLIIAARRALGQSDEVRSAFATYLHLMIDALGSLVFPHLPALAELTLDTNSPADAIELLRLLSQFVSRFRGNMREAITELWLPVLERVLTYMNDGTLKSLQAEVKERMSSASGGASLASNPGTSGAVTPAHSTINSNNAAAKNFIPDELRELHELRRVFLAFLYALQTAGLLLLRHKERRASSSATDSNELRSKSTSPATASSSGVIAASSGLGKHSILSVSKNVAGLVPSLELVANCVIPSEVMIEDSHLHKSAMRLLRECAMGALMAERNGILSDMRAFFWQQALSSGMQLVLRISPQRRKDALIEQAYEEFGRMQVILLQESEASFAEYLQQQVLPATGCSEPNSTNEYLQVLSSSNSKHIRRMLISFGSTYGE